MNDTTILKVIFITTCVLVVLIVDIVLRSQFMKYIKVNIDPIRIKADLDDLEQLQQDLYEKVSAMVEAETLTFSIDDEDESDGELDD